ncbi:formylglycine-generating enzyme family protein [Nocardia sp. NPDC057668]|uniref:formylglycine-generating enzyme family protein n=1 Tax=Nocardia sp. NPDC057668 TaxID=3346202 RepID=UPI003671A0DD
MTEVEIRTAVGELIRIPAQSLLQGDAGDPEEGPVREVTVESFRIQAHQVTNAQFAVFVADTGYRTVAERELDPAHYPDAPPENLRPGSMVFQRTAGPVNLRDMSQWWRWTPGAAWNHPRGPRSSLRGLESHPVVHIAYADADAYAEWAGLRLPTEEQWETAARGGLPHARFTWGDEPERPGQRLANYWHGEFPYLPDTGYGRTAPVGSFAPNPYGLYDMAGNVWEWTTDLYAPSRATRSCCAADTFDPRQPGFPIERRVLKGGSFLCADSYCLRYRPAARRPHMVDTGMSHIGFRCVADA